MKKWLTTKDAAKALGISVSTLKRRLANGVYQTKMEATGRGRGGLTKLVLINEQRLKKVVEEPKIKGSNQRVNGEPLSNSLQNKNLDSFKGSKSKNTSMANSLQINKLNKIKGSNSLKTVKVQTVVQPKVQPAKTLILSDFNKSIEWIPLEIAVQRFTASRRTFFNKIKSNEFLTQKVGNRTFVHLSGFSSKVQAEWKQQQLERLGKNLPVAVKQEQKDFELYAKEDRDKAYARKTIVDEYRKQRQHAKENGIKLGVARISFENAVNEGVVCLKELKVLGYTSISYKTIDKWDKKLRDSGNTIYPLCLVENRKNNAGRRSSIPKDVVAKIIEMAVNHKELSSTEILRTIHRLNEFDTFMSERRCREIVTLARKNKYEVLVNKGKKAYKDGIKPHVHRYNNAFPNQKWESYGHTMNNFVQSPFIFHHNKNFQELVRPVVIVWYDIATGMITGLVMCLSENANAIRTSLRDAIEKFGVPESIRLDNGTAYKNVKHTPWVFAGQKRETNNKKIAIEMLRLGDEGLYKNLGIKKVQFSTPGNPESKGIESFWNFCLSHFEKAFPVWIGNKIENRPENLRLTSKALHRKYGDKIPSWTQYFELLKRYADIWNNQKRSVLRNANGEMMSPAEAYAAEASELTIPSKSWLDSVMRDPYPIEGIVNRGEMYCNGLFYSHEMFMAYSGQKLAYYYDERKIESVKIGNIGGEIWQEPATLNLVGLQVGDSMEALADTRRREKLGKSVIAKLKASDAKTIREQHKALEQPLEHLIVDQSRVQESHKASTSNLFKTRKIKATEIVRKQEIDPLEELDELFAQEDFEAKETPKQRKKSIIELELENMGL